MSLQLHESTRPRTLGLELPYLTIRTSSSWRFTFSDNTGSDREGRCVVFEKLGNVIERQGSVEFNEKRKSSVGKSS